MTALATKRHQLARRNVTDRALRYRANAAPPPGPKLRGTDTVAGRSNPASAEQKALVKLERLPKMDPAIWDRQGIYRESSGDQRKAPFKGAQSSGVRKIMSEVDAKAAKFGSLKAAINQAPLQKVSLRKLNGLQAAVDANKVRAKIQEIVKTDELAAPAVVRLRGKLYLIDGYHSLTALKLLGGKTVEASVAAL